MHKHSHIDTCIYMYTHINHTYPKSRPTGSLLIKILGVEGLTLEASPAAGYTVSDLIHTI